MSSSQSKRKRSRSHSHSRSSSSSPSSGNSSPTTIAPIFLSAPANATLLPNTPKIFVFNSHGTCPTNVHKINPLPVRVITSAKLGCAHHRAVLHPITKEVAQHIAVSFKDECDKQYRKTLTGGTSTSLPALAMNAITQMDADNITKSSPALHERGDELEDMELFCNGLTMAEGVYVMHLDHTGTFVMADASSHFGLTTRKDSDRFFFASPRPKFPDPLPPEMVKSLHRKRKHLELRKTSVFGEPFDIKDRLNTDIHAYNASVYMTKNISAESRLQPKYQLLSNLLDIGIRNGTINPDIDCVVIFACRKLKQRHKPTPGGKKNTSNTNIRIYNRKTKTIRRSNKIKLRNNNSKKI
jgi:hypothetical protein